jgi:hypothetical protein
MRCTLVAKPVVRILSLSTALLAQTSLKQPLRISVEERRHITRYILLRLRARDRRELLFRRNETARGFLASWKVIFVGNWPLISESLPVTSPSIGVATSVAPNHGRRS